MQGLVIDESAVSRARVQPSCFWLRLPAICMTFDPSPTRAPHSPLPAKLSTLSLSLSLSLSFFSTSSFFLLVRLSHLSSPRERFAFPPPFLLPLASSRPSNPPVFDGSIYFCNSRYLSNPQPDQRPSIPCSSPCSPVTVHNSRLSLHRRLADALELPSARPNRT